MAIFAAVLDACVMVPVSLCDTLLRLAEEQLYRPIWSTRILAETSDAISSVHPDLDASKIERRIAYMSEAFPGACVGTSLRSSTDWSSPILTTGTSWPLLSGLTRMRSSPPIFETSRTGRCDVSIWR